MEKIIEKITVEMIAEGIGLVFAIGVIYYLFFAGGLSGILRIFGQAMCG